MSLGNIPEQDCLHDPSRAMAYLNKDMRVNEAVAVKRIGGIEILDTSSDQLVELLHSRYAEGNRTVLFFANMNFVTECQPLRAEIEADDVLVVNDGVGMDAASYMFYGAPFRENLNGTDFVPHLLRSLREPRRVYLLGGVEAAVAESGRIWSGLPNVEIVGARDGYSFWRDQQTTVEEINAKKTDMLFVAFGNPLQERWILENREHLQVPIIIAVGALFDFVSGIKRRAPPVLRAVRLEWLHRLFTEPKRLLRRYTLGVASFVYVCMKSRRSP